MTTTRVRIDLSARIIEIEGSESFVAKYLEHFEGLFDFSVNSIHSKGPKKRRLGHPPAERTKKSKKKVGAGSGKSAQRVVAEKYDIHGNSDIPSLEDFYSTKKPGSANGDIIAVVGYYITEILGNANFTEGQIDYSYKMLSLDRPKHLHQVMINHKNKKDYYQQADEDDISVWEMTRGGQIFVSDKLPSAD